MFIFVRKFSEKYYPFVIIVIIYSTSYGQPDGFTSLFNGHNLEGWWGLDTVNPESWLIYPKRSWQKKRNSLSDIHNHWRVENKELINDGKGLYPTTIQNFADFELHLEYKTVPLADSGIYLRGYPRFKYGTRLRQAESGGMLLEKGSGGYGITVPKTAGNHLFMRTSLLENGIIFGSLLKEIE